MSYVTTAPVLIAEAAGQLRGIGLTVSAANATAAFPTTGVMPAAADEVSAMAAARFAAYGQEYQAIGAHAGMIHERFVSALDASADSYAAAEAANMRSVGLSNSLSAAASAQQASHAGRGGHGGGYGRTGFRGGYAGVHRGGYAHQQLAAVPASQAPAGAAGQAVTQETVHGVPAGGVPIHQVSTASAASAVPSDQPVNLTQAAPAHQAPAAAHPAPAHQAPAAAHPAPAHQAPAAAHPAPATTHEAPAPAAKEPAAAAHRPAPEPAYKAPSHKALAAL